jgi:hypothetical protein
LFYSKDQSPNTPSAQSLFLSIQSIDPITKLTTDSFVSKALNIISPPFASNSLADISSHIIDFDFYIASAIRIAPSSCI